MVLSFAWLYGSICGWTDFTPMAGVAQLQPGRSDPIWLLLVDAARDLWPHHPSAPMRI